MLTVPTWTPQRAPRRSPRPSPRRRDTVASWVVSAFLVLASLAQAPGRIVPETKLDVALDPWSYLGRALSAWDPSAGFGRVQNQALGYLFPMGPWFALGRTLGLPPWLTQRLWLAAILLAGYWGALLVARELGIASAGGRVVTGLGYTLSAATMGVVAFQSAGQLPFALAPWVLLPLLRVGDGPGPRRAAARSGLAVLAMGGVNGASTLAVLPLALVWFTTRRPGPDRRRLLGWWLAAVGAATAWWVVALAVSARYGLRFTEFTEQASVTTSTESAAEVWRGTGNWLGRLNTAGGPWLPGAWQMATAPVAVVASLALVGVGAIGLARRDAPGRSWLVPSALLGAIVLGVGYGGAAGGSFADSARSMLDGPLVAFRNVHKFSALVRLPLAVGLGHAVTVAGTALAERRSHPWEAVSRRGRLAVALSAAGLVVLAVFPLVHASVTAPGSFAAVPDAWRDAGQWVDRRDDGTRTLVVPSAAFAENEWGRPLDEPWGVVADGSWAVRDLIPLGGNGSTRLLDGIDAALRADRLPPGFAEALGRAGIGHLVVRNDLDPARTGAPEPAAVRARLDAPSSGLRRVAAFGPRRQGVAQIEVYRVPHPAARAVAYPLAGLVRAGGAAEAMVDLPSWLADGRPVAFGSLPSVGDGPATVLATDSARRRDVDFGAVRNNTTYTLTADEPSPVTGGSPRDRWQGDDPPDLAVARLVGAGEITAFGGRADDGPTHAPFAAFDGDPATSWTPSAPAVGRWIDVDLGAERRIDRVVVRIPSTRGERVRSVAVVTDRGRRSATVDADGAATVRLDDPTRRVRVRIDATVAGLADGPVGLAEIELYGPDRLAISRPVQATSPGPATALSFRRDPTEDAALDRLASIRGADDWILQGTSTAGPGRGPAALVEAARAAPTVDALQVEASGWSGRIDDHPSLAADGDRSTGWVSDRSAQPASLRVGWTGPVTVEHLRVLTSPAGPRPQTVDVSVGGRTLRRRIPDTGHITIPPTRAEAVELSFDTDRAGTHETAIAEVEIDGVRGRTVPPVDDTVPLPRECGAGPRLLVDGRPIATRALGTVGDLVHGDPVAWVACEPVPARDGVVRFTAPAALGDDPDVILAADTLVGWTPSGSTLGPASASTAPAGPSEPPRAAAPTPAPRSVRIGRWDATRRDLTVGPGTASVVTLTENANDGWRATLRGRQLAAVTIDGWRQGFVVPAGAGGTVALRFAPAPAQPVAVALLILGLVVLALAATVPAQRTARPLGERSWPDPALIALGVAVGLALGGPIVLALGVFLVAPGRRRWLPLVIAGALTAMAVAIVVHPVGGGLVVGPYSGWAQAFATVAWLALAASALSPDWPAPGARADGPTVTPAAGSTPSTRDPSARRPPRTGSMPGGTG